MGERSKRHPNPETKVKAESAKRFPRDTLIKLRSGKAPSKDSKHQNSQENNKVLERESNASNAKELRGDTRERERVWVCVLLCVFVSNEKTKNCKNNKKKKSHLFRTQYLLNPN